MKRWLSTGFLVVALACTSSSHAEPSEAPAALSAEARMAGDFLFAGGDAERTALTRAIDRSVAPFFFAIRGIVRGKLEDKTKIASRVTLRFENGQIRCGIPGAPDAVSPADGRPVDYTVGGDTVKLSQRVDGGRLVQTFATADGSRTNIYVPTEDGERYTMHVTIKSPKLSVPVVYALTYARKR